jgi:hypothetical protein
MSQPRGGGFEREIADSRADEISGTGLDDLGSLTAYERQAGGGDRGISSSTTSKKMSLGRGGSGGGAGALGASDAGAATGAFGALAG